MKKIKNNFGVDALSQTGILLSNEELRLIIAGNSVKYGNYGISLLDDNGELLRYVSYSEMESNGNLGSDFNMAWGYIPGYSPSSWGHYSSFYGSSFGSYDSSVLEKLSSSMLCYMDQHNIGIEGGNPLGPVECVNHNYNSGDNTIHLNNGIPVGYGELVHEFTHAYQQNEGMLGDRIYREFESYMAQKIALAATGGGYSGVFENFATQVVDYDINSDSLYVNMARFKAGLKAQFEDFKNNYKSYYNYETPSGSYDSYNFNWEGLFRTIGIKMR